MPKGIYVRSEEFKEKCRNRMLGMKFSEETKKRMKESQPKDSNHYNYKGGVSKDPVYRSWVKNRRNRMKRISKVKHSFEEWNELKKKYNYTCLSCLKKEPEIKLTEDHIIPISKGGDDNIENIQPLCRSCNCKKSAKEINYAEKYIHTRQVT